MRFGPPSSRSKKQPYLAADIAISRAADAPDIAPPLPSTIHRDGDESGASEGGGVGGARPDVGQSNGSKHGDGIAAIPLEAPSEQCGNRLQNCSANVTGAVSDSWCDDVAREGCGNGENASVGKEAEDNSLGAESAVETPGSSGSAKSVFLLEHCFFCGLPGWGGPGTEGAWDELKLEESAVVVPELRHALDVKHFDPRWALFLSSDLSCVAYSSGVTKHGGSISVGYGMPFACSSFFRTLFLSTVSPLACSRCPCIGSRWLAVGS